MILGKVYRPEPRKNIVFSVYGACAALGFFGGIFFSGIAGEYLNWRWYFYIGSILSAITALSSFVSIPKDYSTTRASSKASMNWVGCMLLVPGTVLFVFAIADSAHAPQQWLYEAAGDLPTADVRQPGDLSALCSTLAVSSSPQPGVSFCITQRNITHNNLGAGLPRLKSPLRGDPPGCNYWAFVFPAMICGTIGIDISFDVTNIFIKTNMPGERQGLAGALINCTLHMGIAVMLAFADLIQTCIHDQAHSKTNLRMPTVIIRQVHGGARESSDPTVRDNKMEAAKQTKILVSVVLYWHAFRRPARPAIGDQAQADEITRRILDTPTEDHTVVLTEKLDNWTLNAELLAPGEKPARGPWGARKNRMMWTVGPDHEEVLSVYHAFIKWYEEQLHRLTLGLLMRMENIIFWAEGEEDDPTRIIHSRDCLCFCRKYPSY
ncbi:uncharacterized protein BP01DRAFT_363108 [Aspergillus saccharolyticus JOP 1030-1]|uniref:MFS general substrate transporter n=1 Tax=Aspergillus saccharolyticus JOP 1030-1 TaxID=1450539 RepID=A0A319AQG0_9EURO|nr:hypothetical protein BP01DRAFT_363108 [Aspergillus saccharolyticus JOP 1030-1]PYH48642.1 hypothetical protein BP01DRAFT_363108 [Aspergillus saccharolyticus JOP 1030-1]